MGTGEGSAEAIPIRYASERIIAQIEAEDWDAVYDEMTWPARRDLPENEFLAQIRDLIGLYGVPSGSTILEIHLGDFSRGRPRGDLGGLRSLRSRSDVLPNPIFVASPAAGHAAVVLCDTTTRDQGLRCWLTLAVSQEDGLWGLDGFFISPHTVRGRGGAWYADEAKRLEFLGKPRCAHLYRGIASVLLAAGRYIAVPSAALDPGGVPTGDVPPGLPSPGVRPAEYWTTRDGATFRVVSVDSVMGPGSLAVEIGYEPLPGDRRHTDAEAERRELLEHLTDTFPEYAEGFDGVALVRHGPDGEISRDLYRFSRGPAPPPEAGSSRPRPVRAEPETEAPRLQLGRENDNP